MYIYIYIWPFLRNLDYNAASVEYYIYIPYCFCFNAPAAGASTPCTHRAAWQ